MFISAMVRILWWGEIQQSPNENILSIAGITRIVFKKDKHRLDGRTQKIEIFTKMWCQTKMDYLPHYLFNIYTMIYIVVQKCCVQYIWYLKRLYYAGLTLQGAYSESWPFEASKWHIFARNIWLVNFVFGALVINYRHCKFAGHAHVFLSIFNIF